MSEASFASLGPTLLARKGGAKPAMRPQLAPLPGVVPPEAGDQLEDLGWNDMGGDDAANIVSIKPPKQVAANQDEPFEDDALGTDAKLIKDQQKQLAKHILAESDSASPAKKPAARKPAARKSSAKQGRAAFTLRLDKDRHLKLRLAATMQGISAQALVTEALDALLADIDDLDSLAQRFTGRIKQPDPN